MSKSNTGRKQDDEETVETEHLEGIGDGCGCTEVWEGLSEYRQKTD